MFSFGRGGGGGGGGDGGNSVHNISRPVPENVPPRLPRFNVKSLTTPPAGTLLYICGGDPNGSWPFDPRKTGSRPAVMNFRRFAAMLRSTNKDGTPHHTSAMQYWPLSRMSPR